MPIKKTIVVFYGFAILLIALSQHRDAFMVVVSFTIIFAIFCTGVECRKQLVRVPLRVRLPIEISTLIVLLGFSAVTWNPYTWQAEQCQNLAREALQAIKAHPEGRATLEREAAWFNRRAEELRWRGFWLGLMLGPAAHDERRLGKWDLTYQLGTLESMEKHEKAIDRYLPKS